MLSSSADDTWKAIEKEITVPVFSSSINWANFLLYFITTDNHTFIWSQHIEENLLQSFVTSMPAMS